MLFIISSYCLNFCEKCFLKIKKCDLNSILLKECGQVLQSVNNNGKILKFSYTIIEKYAIIVKAWRAGL